MVPGSVQWSKRKGTHYQEAYYDPFDVCKVYPNMWYITKFDKYMVANYLRTLAQIVNLERKLVYQIFVLLRTHCSKQYPQFTVRYVLSIIDKITVDILHCTLESSIKIA